MKSNVYPSSVHEWMSAIRRPTPYRVGNARLHVKTRTVAYAVLFTLAILTLLLFLFPTHHNMRMNCIEELKYHDFKYDFTYPLTPLRKIGNGYQFKIGLISDLDQNSKSKDKKDTWISYFHEGNLTISHTHNYADFVLEDKPHILKSTLSQKGRGMELSELQVFNGQLYTVDDRTGVIYRINNYKVYPWVILADGDGNSPKGFKCEWATIKNNRMYVGGLGKEWTSLEGVVENLNPQWVKSVGMNGDVRHIDWHTNYNIMREKAGFRFPGYVIHESAVWSDIHQRWFFLPRRASALKYEETADERRAANIMIIANEEFTDIKITYIGEKSDTRGFSSFKFIPETNDQVIVALKSEEVSGKIASYLTVFTVQGETLLKEKQIGDIKYEGIEFI